MERRIGVALSGGGYRAAAWALGVFLYLADAGLSRRVTTSSSVSGGSITNAAMALAPYGSMRPQEVWSVAGGLASKLAGDLRPFLGVLILHVVAWTTAIVSSATHRPLITVAGLAVAILLSVLLAPLCRDATFGSRITWLYFDALALSIALLAFLAGQGWWWAGGVLLVGLVLLLRGVAIGWAIGRSLLQGLSGRAQLRDLSADIDHVLCACDLHGRHHVYFGKDFVYSFRHGLGTRPSLPLDAAVQSSANLPGAFPPRPMRSSPFLFTDPRDASPLLALTDGGVYDNMADEWLLSFRQRTASWLRRAKEVAVEDPTLGSNLRAAAERLVNREPNFLVIANASGSLGSRFAWTTFLPIVGELLALLRVKSILYDNGNSTRRRYIVDQFIDGDLSGIIVHIDTHPTDIFSDGKASADRTVKARAEAAETRMSSTPGFTRAGTEEEAGTGTTLYPLGRGRIAKLMQRSYAIACIQAHIWYDLPLVEIPDLAWFEALEQGRVAERPTPPTAETKSAELEHAEPGDTLPLWVDAIRDVAGTTMARVTYFVVTSEVPEPAWLIEVGEGHGASLMALGTAGVISGPGPRSGLFRDPRQLGTLFEQIEQAADLSIEVEDLSLPLSWFGSPAPARGDVYRIDRDLFQAAYRFRLGELSQEAYLESWGVGSALQTSPEEAIAFREWAQARIDDAKDIYPKVEELKLAELAET
jgi:predicted acylesterase/phospholipase RssA